LYHQIIREIEMQYGTTLANLGYRWGTARCATAAAQLLCTGGTVHTMVAGGCVLRHYQTSRLS
jgi:hypothetical protein